MLECFAILAIGAFLSGLFGKSASKKSERTYYPSYSHDPDYQQAVRDIALLDELD